MAFAIAIFAGSPAVADGNCDSAKAAKQAAEDAKDRAEVDVSIAQAIGDQDGIDEAVDALTDANSALAKAEEDVTSLCYAPSSGYSSGSTSGSSGTGDSNTSSRGSQGSGSSNDRWLDVERDMCRMGIPGFVNVNTCSMCFDIQAGSWNGRVGGWGTGYTCAHDEPQPKCIVRHQEGDSWLQRRMDRHNCEITH